MFQAQTEANNKILDLIISQSLIVIPLQLSDSYHICLHNACPTNSSLITQTLAKVIIHQNCHVGAPLLLRAVFNKTKGLMYISRNIHKQTDIKQMADRTGATIGGLAQGYMKSFC